MNLDTHQPKTSNIPHDDLEDFDFKPLTSGLGFHQPAKTTEIKPTITEKRMSTPVQSVPVSPRKETTVYQNDLSLFYGREAIAEVEKVEVRPVEKTYKLASPTQRITAYLLDMGFVLSCLGVMLTIMSRMIEMDLVETWSAYPNEITPLVLTLFAGFYLMYFSIFEKTASSTVGKSLLNLRVVNLDNKSLTFIELMFRSFISLLNFITLGLFSYFDLQSKITSSKVIRSR
jgi:uncharacterized RDD family membrane protein YckC